MGWVRLRIEVALEEQLLRGLRWHADITPHNILNIQGRFKLADPGFMKFIKSTNQTPKEVLSGGTETYGT